MMLKIYAILTMLAYPAIFVLVAATTGCMPHVQVQPATPHVQVQPATPHERTFGVYHVDCDCTHIITLGPTSIEIER